MPMPELDATSRKRPLSYDPERCKFIFFDDLVSGKERAFPVEDLSDDDLKKLVIERWRVLPKETTVQAISGPPYRRDDVIRAIQRDEPYGRELLQAEVAYLKMLLEEIQSSLKQKPEDSPAEPS